MNKPISKHALRRAIDRVVEGGHMQLNEPAGTVIDRIWRELEKKNYNGARKKPLGRETVRTAAPDVPELG